MSEVAVARFVTWVGTPSPFLSELTAAGEEKL
jgi:hypothetical protein